LYYIISKDDQEKNQYSIKCPTDANLYKDIVQMSGNTVPYTPSNKYSPFADDVVKFTDVIQADA
jgi:hypothetical protein